MTDLNYFEGILQVVFFCLFFILAPAPPKHVSERETKFVSARDNFVAPAQKMSRTETIRANLSRTETISRKFVSNGDNFARGPWRGRRLDTRGFKSLRYRDKKKIEKGRQDDFSLHDRHHRDRELDRIGLRVPEFPLLG